MKLNLGCGRNVLEGWTNVDKLAGRGVDVGVPDLDAAESLHVLSDESCEEFLLSHVLEHLRDPLALFQQMYRIAKPDARAVVRCPYGSSDDADEDPTHVRRMFLGSWGYFGQPHYWRADYGYGGDWKCERVTLFLDPRCKGQESTIIFRERNTVLEMVAELRAVKPAREARRELQEQPEIVLTVVEPEVANR